MKGLLIKDIYTIKKAIIAISLLGVFYIVMVGANKESAPLLAMMTLLLPMFSVTSFYYDDMTKWDKYAAALPIKKYQIVLSKYVLSVILMFVGIAYIVVSTSLISLFFGEQMFSLIFVPTIVSISGGLIFSGVIMPLIYKFGVEKGRIMMIILAVIFGAFVGGFMNVQKIEFLAENVNLLVTIMFAVSLILFLTSYQISIRLYEKKEF